MKKAVVSTLVAGVAVLASCGSPQGLIIEGSSSKFDSLSYALGVNIGSSFSVQMADIPLDYSMIAEGVNETVFDRGTLSYEAAVETLQAYFTTTRGERSQIVESRRAEADSIALANGATQEEVAAARAMLKADADMFESEEQRHDVSYAFGVDIGRYLKAIDSPLHTYWFNKAMVDAYNGSSTMEEAVAQSYLQNYFSVILPAERAALSEKNLAKIEKQSGVIKTESGLLYRIEEAGDMSVVATDDRDVVSALYTGRLLRNNTVFDTNRFADRSAEEQEAIITATGTTVVDDEPLDLPLNRVIRGWTEGLKLVGKGGRVSLWIPAELAYGEQGAGRDIGPNDALYFDVEVVDVTPYEAAE